jgi:hypothetical protein
MMGGEGDTVKKPTVRAPPLSRDLLERSDDRPTARISPTPTLGKNVRGIG